MAQCASGQLNNHHNVATTTRGRRAFVVRDQRSTRPKCTRNRLLRESVSAVAGWISDRKRSQRKKKVSATMKLRAEKSKVRQRKSLRNETEIAPSSSVQVHFTAGPNCQ